MARDIVNGTAFQSAIADALEGLPPALQDYHSALKSFYIRTQDQHPTIRKARRRKEDPAWAHHKFAKGLKLYRFNERRRQDLIRWIRIDFDSLAEIAELAQQRVRPMAREAQAFLKGIPHSRDRYLNDLEPILAKARSADLKARRYQTLREPAQFVAGSLQATRCSSLNAIIRLGRWSGNCLAENKTYWERFVSGEIDIWSFREDGVLVAVAAVNLASNQVIEARGLCNRNIEHRHISDVALFSRNAGFFISRDCDSALVEYAESRCWAERSWCWKVVQPSPSYGRPTWESLALQRFRAGSRSQAALQRCDRPLEVVNMADGECPLRPSHYLAPD